MGPFTQEVFQQIQRLWQSQYNEHSLVTGVKSTAASPLNIQEPHGLSPFERI